MVLQCAESWMSKEASISPRACYLGTERRLIGAVLVSSDRRLRPLDEAAQSRPIVVGLLEAGKLLQKRDPIVGRACAEDVELRRMIGNFKNIR